MNSWWGAYEVNLMTHYIEEPNVWTWTVTLNRRLFKDTSYFKMREEETWGWAMRTEQMNGKYVESVDDLEECYNNLVSLKWGGVLSCCKVNS